MSRSFKTLEEAYTFVADKQGAEIYKSNGAYKVEWVKVSDNNGDQLSLWV